MNTTNTQQKMKTLLKTTAFLLCLSAATYGQNQSDSTGKGKSLVSPETRQDINQTVNKVEDRANEEYQQSVQYQNSNELTWFQQGNAFGGVGLGTGVANSKFFLGLNARAGYFVQPGFAVGLVYSNERLIGNSYRARQVGVMARYYPFRTRVSSFVGANLSRGREFSDDIPDGAKERYTSVGLEIGAMAWIYRRLGAELSYQSNFYNKINPVASLSRGGRVRLGVNYAFGQVGKRKRNR